jgi:CheY-like chemotaxis protein
MMMPIMNGLEAAKKIQEMIDNNEINDDLKIIIVSAHIEENLLKELKHIKCICEEVNKPLKKCKLEELLNTFYF